MDPQIRRAAVPSVIRNPIAADASQAAAYFSQVRFGGLVRVKSSTVTVLTSGTQILDQNPRRVGWLLVNRGVNDAAIDYYVTPTFANGVILGAGGGSAVSEVQEDGESVAYPVFGIANTASVVFRVWEYILQVVAGA